MGTASRHNAGTSTGTNSRHSRHSCSGEMKDREARTFLSGVLVDAHENGEGRRHEYSTMMASSQYRGGGSSTEPHNQAPPLSGVNMAGAVCGSPHIYRAFFKIALGTTVALYVLNQKHLLPKPLSRVVSKALFWPTLPITFARRVGKWMTDIDGTVVLGGAPFGFTRIPETLRKKKDVSLIKWKDIELNVVLCETFCFNELGSQLFVICSAQGLLTCVKSIKDLCANIKRSE
jgi:hypothetical protein